MSKNVLAGLVALALVGAACGDDGGGSSNNSDNNGGNNGGETAQPFSEDCTTFITPSDAEDAAEAAEENRINLVAPLAEPTSGDVICIGDGTYTLTSGLTLNAEVSDIEIRGQSQDGTILDFDGQDDGANGILVDGIDGFRAANFTIKNTAGDGIKVQNGDGIELVNLTVTWDTPSSEENGAYGVYPVLDTNVLIEGCEVSHASDAGIYVGQSDNVIARNNVAFGNVAGLEIENTSNAEVYDNHLHDNTGGLLVFNLPGLDVKDGSHNKIRNNLIENNNTVNFAKSGTIVSRVPRGVGVMLLSTDHNEVHDNEIVGNKSVGLAIVSFLMTREEITDEEYDPYSEANFIHDNTFEDNGNDPKGLALALNGGEALPAMGIDGFFNPEVGASINFEDARDCFDANVTPDGSEAGFMNYNGPGGEGPAAITDCSDTWTDFCHYQCTREPLPSVTLE